MLVVRITELKKYLHYLIFAHFNSRLINASRNFQLMETLCVQGVKSIMISCGRYVGMLWSRTSLLNTSAATARHCFSAQTGTIPAVGGMGEKWSDLTQSTQGY